MAYHLSERSSRSRDSACTDCPFPRTGKSPSYTIRPECLCKCKTIRTFRRNAPESRADPHAGPKPDIMLLDEPFSALDYQTRLNVSDDIGQIIKKRKKQRSLSPMTLPKRSVLLTGSLFSQAVRQPSGKRSMFPFLIRDFPRLPMPQCPGI